MNKKIILLTAFVFIAFLFNFTNAENCPQGLVPVSSDFINAFKSQNPGKPVPKCINPNENSYTSGLQTAAQFLKARYKGGKCVSKADIAIDNLNPKFAVCAANFLKAFEQQYNKRTSVVNAYRSPSQQQCVCMTYFGGYISGKCAHPAKWVPGKGYVGGSNHQRGIAIDVGLKDKKYSLLHAFANKNPEFGVWFPIPKSDPVHMQPREKGSPKCITQGFTPRAPTQDDINAAADPINAPGYDAYGNAPGDQDYKATPDNNPNAGQTPGAGDNPGPNPYNQQQNLSDSNGYEDKLAEQSPQITNSSSTSTSTKSENTNDDIDVFHQNPDSNQNVSQTVSPPPAVTQTSPQDTVVTNINQYANLNKYRNQGKRERDIDSLMYRHILPFSTAHPSKIYGLNPKFARCVLAIMRASQASGVSAQIKDGYRTQQEQLNYIQEAKIKYGNNYAFIYAEPVTKSTHTNGIAIDLKFANLKSQAWFYSHAKEFGIHFPSKLKPYHAVAYTSLCGTKEASPYGKLADKQYKPNKIALPKIEQVNFTQIKQISMDDFSVSTTTSTTTQNNTSTTTYQIPEKEYIPWDKAYSVRKSEEADGVLEKLDNFFFGKPQKETNYKLSWWQIILRMFGFNI